MFNKLKNFLRNKPNFSQEKKEDTYAVKELHENGNVFILRFKNGLLKYANSKKYSFQIGIATPVKSNNEYPSKQENEQLLVMEQIIEHEYAQNDIAIFAGIVMGGGMKEFVLYTGKPEESSKIFKKLQKEIKHHELQYIIRKDPQWQVYKDFGPNN